MVALLASGLAYGNMIGILRSVQRVLEVLGAPSGAPGGAGHGWQLAGRLAVSSTAGPGPTRW